MVTHSTASEEAVVNIDFYMQGIEDRHLKCANGGADGHLVKALIL
jgi:hypothetical protein